MKSDFLIILSDARPHYNERGAFLPDFLKVFYPAAGINVLEPRQVNERLTSRFTFIALPTRLNRTQINAIDTQKLFLYDYYDNSYFEWADTPERELLRQRASAYFKVHRYSAEQENLPIRLLPINMKSFPWYTRYAMPPITRRRHDLFFLGIPTYLTTETGRYHQRIEWLQEVKHRFKFCGGLVHHPQYPASDYEPFGNVEGLYFRRKQIDSRLYFLMMKSAAIALLPTGHGRWTYRHYEAIVAGCVPVSTDIHNIELLVPLPQETMAIVADHEPIVPVVEEILANRAFYQQWTKHNREYLQAYLHPSGAYSRRHPGAIEAFAKQLEI